MRAWISAGTTGRQTWARAAAWTFAFSCFLPYPALSLGGNTGLQLSQALALASVPFLCARPPGRPFRALLLILAPVFLSLFVNVMVGSVPSLDILPKEATALTIAMLVLWPSEWLASRALFRDVLAAAAAATLLHALIGLVQVYSFESDQFPLLFLYKNPSFKSMEQWHQVYARYIKRPCGLFPEPSAMAASLGPWLVLLAGLLLDPAAGRGLGWRRPRLTAAALAGGFVLLALSRSGSTFAIMAAVLALCVGKMRSRAPAAGAGRFLTMAVVMLAVLAVLGYAASRLSQGLDARIESSWGLRGTSIAAGLTANTDPTSLAVGVGPGQSTPIIRRQLSWMQRPEDEADIAIWSLGVCYYMETGLLGGLALLAVLAMVLRAIARSSAAPLGLCSLGTWLVGVMATTSYLPLSAIWLFLGAMLSWDRLFPIEPRTATAQRP